MAAYLRLIGVSDRAGSIALARLFPGDVDADLPAVETWSRSADTRRAISEYYGENRVSREAAEVDLGLGEERDDFVPFFVRIEGQPPEWAHVGGVVSVEHNPDGWRVRDVVGGRDWTVDEGQTTGLAALTTVAADHVTASLVRPATAG